MKSIETVYSDKKNDYYLKGTVIFLDNNDVIIVVGGGEDHIGAIGLAVPRPSLLDQNRTSATSSILTMIGHKEDELVKYVGENVAAATRQNVAVIAGIHYDNLSLVDLEIIRELWISLADKIILFIKQKKM